MKSPFKTLAQQLEEEKAGKAAADETSAPSPTIQTTGEASTTSGPTSPQPSTGATPQSKSGSFGNLQKFMTANAGFNEQSGGLAGKIASNIGQTGKQFSTNLAGANEAFKTQADTAFKGVDNLDIVRRAAEDPLGFYKSAPAPAPTPQAAAIPKDLNSLTKPQVDPKQPTVMGADGKEYPNYIYRPGDPGYQTTKPVTPGQFENLKKLGSYSKFQEVGTDSPSTSSPISPELTQEQAMAKVAAARDAAYTGGQDLNALQGNQNYGQLATQAGQIAGQSRAAQSEKGRYGLLQQMFGKQGYTKGQQSLDNALLGGNEALRTLGKTRALGIEAERGLGSAQTEARGLASDLSKQAATIKDESRKALNAGVGTIDTAVNADVAAKQAEADATLENVRKALASGEMSADDVTRFGLEGQTLFLDDLDPSKLISSTGTASRTNVLSDQNKAKLAALQNMLGNEAANPEMSKVLAELSGGTNTFDADSYGIDKKALADRAAQYGEWQGGRLLGASDIEKQIQQYQDIYNAQNVAYAKLQEQRHDSDDKDFWDNAWNIVTPANMFGGGILGDTVLNNPVYDGINTAVPIVGDFNYGVDRDIAKPLQSAVTPAWTRPASGAGFDEMIAAALSNRELAAQEKGRLEEKLGRAKKSVKLTAAPKQKEGSVRAPTSGSGEGYDLPKGFSNVAADPAAAAAEKQKQQMEAIQQYFRDHPLTFSF